MEERGKEKKTEMKGRKERREEEREGEDIDNFFHSPSNSHYQPDLNPSPPMALLPSSILPPLNPQSFSNSSFYNTAKGQWRDP